MTDVTTVGNAAPRTTVPSRPQGRPPQPRRLTSVRAPDVLSLAGGLGAALCTTGVLWTQVAPFSGLVGFVVVTWFLFVFYYAVLVSFDQDRPAVLDRVVWVVVQSLGVLVALALFFVIIYTFGQGFRALLHLNFYTQDLHVTGPLAPLSQGGVIHAIVGTLIELGIAMAIAAPLGLLTAVFMHEVPGTLSRLVRTVVDAMTALPDVLAGLFIYSTLVLFFHRFFGFAAACALGVTVVPIVARASYVVLRLVPGGLTEASYALGSGQWRTVRYVTLPTARSGLATAMILGAARAIGETAPVLLTAGVSAYLNFNPISGPMMSLPLLAYISVQSPEKTEITRGFGAACILLIVVVILFFIARKIGGRGPGQLTAAQQRRRVLGSRRDLARYQQYAAMRATRSAEYEYEYPEEEA
jgi:phosphate transport system permease protein